MNRSRRNSQFSTPRTMKARLSQFNRFARLLTAAALCGAAIAANAASQSTSEPVPSKPAKPRIEVCFVLDTTGSMGGLIEGAKQKIWSIANELISAKPTPELKLGLIGYRDRGDEYVTKLFDLTDDIDAIYGHLKEFRANGGGDTPESVNRALREAVRQARWSQDCSVLKIVFLVGDAPPHNYADEPGYRQICQEAVKRDLIINTVQCGNLPGTMPVWQEIARLAEGAYVAIGQTGNMVVTATPMDKELAELNRALGGTLITYGDERERRSVLRKQAVAEMAPAAAAADRLSYNLATGKAVQGGGELLGALANGSVRLESVKKDYLPAELRTLSEVELKQHVEKQQAARKAIQTKIQELSRQRETYLQAERKRLAASGKGDAFDEKVAETIRRQAAGKGIRYTK